MGLQKKQNLHISELVQLIFDLNIKTERFSIKIAPKHIIFDYLFETNKRTGLIYIGENHIMNLKGYLPQISII